MEKGGRLRILATCDGEETVEISFADTHRVIEPEHIDRIFEPFLPLIPMRAAPG